MKFYVNNASFAYRDKPVFEGVSFEVNSGEILAILGPNGSGKTTLLRAICGMLRLGGGTSIIDGENVSAIPERRLWSLMSYVPQIRNAATSFTVLESVLLGLCSRIGVFSTPGDGETEKAEEVLELLGISHLRDKRCHELSGGELQMVLIARALVSDPKLLILDEPESGLDFRNQMIVLDTLSRLSRDGIACIFNTHYPEHALRYADKSLLLSGTHAVFGETEAILTPENIEKAFGVSVMIHEFDADGDILRSVIPLCTKDKRI